MGANLLFYSRKGISWKKCSFDGSSAGTDHRTMEAIGAVGHAAGSLNAKSERAYLTGTEIALLEDSSLFIIGIGILVLMEAFFVVVIISLLLHGVMKLIRLCLAKGYSCLTRKKRSRQRAAARRIQKRQEALLLQYVLESEERTKEMPDVLKLPEFMVNRERRNKHAY